MSVLVGGIGQLYQGDLDFGRVAADRLMGEELGASVVVEELHYGAIAVAQRLEELQPDSVIFVGAAQRGRVPGSVERRRIGSLELSPDQVQSAVGDAVTGYVTMDLAIEVTSGLGALPPRTVAIEVEPAQVEPSESLSPEAAGAMEEALTLVRREVRLAPLLTLTDQLALLLQEGHLGASPAFTAVQDLLRELRRLDDSGHWGAVFSLRDRLRLHIAAGETGEGMGHLDWGLWWTLIEELDRLQSIETK